MKSPNFARLIATSAVVLFPFGAVKAADVLFVDSEVPNAGWQEFIESGGHTFTLFDTASYNISLNNQDSIDYVNSFDVIIISGSNPVFNAIRAHGATWNAQPTPMITLGNFLVSGQFSSASWRWTTPGNGGTTNFSGAVDVLDEDDPIWTGMSLEPGTPPTISLFSGNAGHLTLGSNTFLPGITTVATRTGVEGTISVAYAEPGALREGGGGQYFIAGMTGGQQNPVNFNDDGRQVFLNAIAALTGGFSPDGPFPVTITRNPDTPGTYDFEWTSQPAKIYDLLTSIDLATPIADWPVHDDGETLYEAIPSAGETTTLTAVPSPDPRRFFAIREDDAPPPPPLFFADFEENNGGFTVSNAEGSAWAWGAPGSTDSDGTPNPGGSVTGGNNGSANAWGTDIDNPGFYEVPTSTVLSSPVIDLTEAAGAELTFAEALDLEGGDTAQVFLVNADTDTDIGGAIHTADDTDISNANWDGVGPIDISAGAGLNIRLEWRFVGQAQAADFMGWYIDDVVVTETTP